MTEPHPADNSSDWRTRPLPEGNWIMRSGSKIGRNLYIEWPDGRSEPVGQVDTVALARFICERVNGMRTSASDRAMFQNHTTGNVGTHIQARDITNLDLS